MSRIIYCIFMKKMAEGQEYKIYPNKLGNIIYKNISKEAWIQWQNKQTILINEKKLNTLNSKDQNFLKKEMINFLFKKNNLKKYQS